MYGDGAYTLECTTSRWVIVYEALIEMQSNKFQPITITIIRYIMRDKWPKPSVEIKYCKWEACTWTKREFQR